MNDFYKKWNEVKQIAIRAFEKKRPKKLYGCRLQTEDCALVTPIKDYFQEHGTITGYKWKDVWKEFEARAKRIDETKASFFELVDQFHFLIENEGPPRLIVGDMYSRATRNEIHFFKQQDFAEISYGHVDCWPKSIQYIYRGAPVQTLPLVRKCVCLGEVQDIKDERHKQLIYHVGYINESDRDQPIDKSNIKFHVRTPVDPSLEDVLTEKYRWSLIEHEQMDIYEQMQEPKSKINIRTAKEPVIMGDKGPLRS